MESALVCITWSILSELYFWKFVKANDILFKLYMSSIKVKLVMWVRYVLCLNVVRLICLVIKNVLHNCQTLISQSAIMRSDQSILILFFPTQCQSILYHSNWKTVHEEAILNWSKIKVKEHILSFDSNNYLENHWFAGICKLFKKIPYLNVI